MRGNYKQILKSKRTLIMQELDLLNTSILDYLYEKDVITEYEKEKLDIEKLSKDKIKAFLDIMSKKGDDAFLHFLEALKMDQPHLAKILERCDTVPAPPRRCHSYPCACCEQESGNPKPLFDQHNTGGARPEKLSEMSVADLKVWMQPVLRRERICATLLDTLEAENISGKVLVTMTEAELEKVFPQLKAFGSRRSMMLAIQEATANSAEPQELECMPPNYLPLQQTDSADGFVSESNV